MRTIYLFRHAPVDFPGGRPCCLGSRTDAPASAEGLAAAARLTPLLAQYGVRAVYCSPMLRCRRTAEAMAGGRPVESLPGLEELDCGDWDGLAFDFIRRRWPEHYALRGLDPALPPPGGEAPEHAAARALAALTALAERTEGNLAVVGHAGVNRALLCRLQGLPMAAPTMPQPFLCMNILHYDARGLTVAAVGRPTKEEANHETAL